MDSAAKPPRTGSLVANGARHTRARLSILVLEALLLALTLARPITATPDFDARRLLRSGQRQLSQVGMAMPCASVSGPTTPAALGALTCLKFHDKGSPIWLPADTPTVKYGQIVAQMAIFPVVALFVDRQGAQHSISQESKPPTDQLELTKIWSMLIVQAQLDAASGAVLSFKPVLYVPFSTVMATLQDMHFEGAVYNSPPRPAGPQETSWIRFTFGSQITVTDATTKYGTLLQGTFDNLFHSVKDASGACRPALCSDPTSATAACKYYVKHFGNSSNAVSLTWDPSMHTPADTELVPLVGSSGRQYMAQFLRLYQLLQPLSWPRQFAFNAHSNPMGVPQSFTGTFVPASSVVRC